MQYPKCQPFGGFGLSYTIESLTGGTQYDVQVRAVSGIGAGPWSATVTGTPTTWGARRSFSPERVAAGGEVEVTIALAGLGGLGFVVETLPAGFSNVSSGLSHSAVQVEGQEVTFTLLGSDSTFTYTVTAASVEGPHSFSGVVSNADAVTQPVGGAFIVTVAAEPGVYVNIARSTASPVRLNSPVPVTVAFSEPVFGFTLDDIDINAGNGAKGNFSGSNGDAVYTFDVTPTAIRTMTVDIAPAWRKMRTAMATRRPPGCHLSHMTTATPESARMRPSRPCAITSAANLPRPRR